ncbi:MAG TPA: putative metal-binding motif-containing protein [Polyangiaceae bacterium]|nr:putative metal-binding motif-containing protein [Polyangiaceae bacterium]
MPGISISRGLFLLSSGWLVVLACGSRTGLLLGRVVEEDDPPPQVECTTAADCPQPPPGQCGVASCDENSSCQLDLGPICDDGDACTVDACEAEQCVHTDGHIDADGDGVFARGTAADPTAPLGCGEDCDDANEGIFPGAVELCDSLDNDCNGIVDDGTGLTPTQAEPKRVSPMNAKSSRAAGLAFDGESFGATMTVQDGTWQGHFRQLDASGNPLGDSQRVAHVNAESYGGPLVWTGQRYLIAYDDARQDDNYEIYFNLLNRQGKRLNEDLRVTNADDFSLRPSVVWTGVEGLLVWDDRRFEDNQDASAIFGQRISLDGQLLGGNMRLSAPGVHGENASIALSDAGVGIAFVSPVAGSNDTVLHFMTASRSLENPSDVTTIEFRNATAPVVTAVGGKYVVTFHEHTAMIGPSIFGVVIGENGIERAPTSMTVASRSARTNATYSYGDRFVMVWAEQQDKYQLYAQVFDAKLAPLSPRMRLTNTATDTWGPALAPAEDGGLGVLYTDESEQQTYFTRLDCVERFLLE